MARSVHRVHESDRLQDAEELLARHDVSALAVVNGRDHLCGLIGRAELVWAGLACVSEGPGDPLLTLPQGRVRELMRTNVEVVSPDTLVRDAARRMVRRRYSRIFVARNSSLLGVLSASDLMRLAEEMQAPMPLGELMTRSIVSVRPADTLRLALERLMAVHHQGLVVMDGAWPVGIFTQAQALAARDAAASLGVDRWMDPRVLCLPVGAPAYYAARQAAVAGVDHIIVTDAEAPCGVVTGLDFGKALVH